MISEDKWFLVKGLRPSHCDDSSVSLCWNVVSWKKGTLHVKAPSSYAFHHSSNNKKRIVVFIFTIFHTDKKNIKTRRMRIKFILKKEKTEQSPGMKLSRNKLHFWAILTPEETWERAPRSETTKKSQFQHTLFGRAKCNWFRRRREKKEKLLRSTITNNKVENSPFLICWHHKIYSFRRIVYFSSIPMFSLLCHMVGG